MSIDLKRETDPEVVRQAALLLEAENRRLLAAEGNDGVALQRELASLQAQLENRNRMLFSPSSERREGESGTEPKARAPQKGHGPRAQKELRVVVEKHVLEASDRVCIMCNGSLEEMGDQADESEEIDGPEPCFNGEVDRDGTDAKLLLMFGTEDVVICL